MNRRRFFKLFLVTGLVSTGVGVLRKLLTPSMPEAAQEAVEVVLSPRARSTRQQHGFSKRLRKYFPKSYDIPINFILSDLARKTSLEDLRDVLLWLQSEGFQDIRLLSPDQSLLKVDVSAERVKHAETLRHFAADNPGPTLGASHLVPLKTNFSSQHAVNLPEALVGRCFNVSFVEATGKDGLTFGLRNLLPVVGQDATQGPDDLIIDICTTINLALSFVALDPITKDLGRNPGRFALAMGDRPVCVDSVAITLSGGNPYAFRYLVDCPCFFGFPDSKSFRITEL